MQRFSEILTRFLRAVTGVTMAAIVIMLFLGVIARYVFSRPFFWAEELAVLGFIVMSFFGAAVLVRRDGNVRITILTDFLSPRANRRLTILSDALCMVMMAVMIWCSYELKLSRDLSLTPALRISEAWAVWAMIIGFCSMLVYQAIIFVGHIRGETAPKKEGGEGSGGGAP